jgi:hypothetical protein
LTVVDGLELCWGDVGVVLSDLAVEPAVVEPVDVAEGGELDVIEAPPRSLGVDQLPLEEAVEGLGHGVVVAVTARSDRGDDVVLVETLGIANAAVAIVLSIWIFDERFTVSVAQKIVAGVAFCVMAMGVTVLSRTAPTDLDPSMPVRL